ncbi:head-tail adaptor protein [Pseudogemmobacter faecipullorum]|uniref:Head-tail adaptor protein n=1 Tax=Pseudogemmobacter faecipullorum TaxID=2755041 RepID=A0ABS8CKU5_9RHOB|nr:head-tail adaptor protein [Pseudogemmobacter faecipullorum]MCB5410012.1 head-tail adaptor protein [Pseudogemmobacter faecipullorum]
MRAPHLNRALLLEQESLEADGAGGFHRSWLALGQLWAAVRAGAGRESPGEELSLATIPWAITLRGAPPGSALRPRPGQRFREGLRIFTILTVAERDAGGRWLICSCREEGAR